MVRANGVKPLPVLAISCATQIRAKRRRPSRSCELVSVGVLVGADELAPEARQLVAARRLEKACRWVQRYSSQSRPSNMACEAVAPPSAFVLFPSVSAPSASLVASLQPYTIARSASSY